MGPPDHKAYSLKLDARVLPNEVVAVRTIVLNIMATLQTERDDTARPTSEQRQSTAQQPGKQSGPWKDARHDLCLAISALQHRCIGTQRDGVHHSVSALG